MNGASGITLESAGPNEECFHCTDDRDKFLPLPRDQQPYCSKCFNALFVFDIKSEENNNNKGDVVKSKPPPVPPKPKGKSPILYSTLPQPFQKPLLKEEVPSIVVASPPSPPPPSPPKSISPDLGIDSDEAPLPPPPMSEPPEIKSSAFENARRAYSPVPTFQPPDIPGKLTENARRPYSPIPNLQSQDISSKQTDFVKRAYSPIPPKSQSPETTSKQLDNLRTAYSPIPPSVVGSSPSGSTASSPNLSSRVGNSPNTFGKNRVGIDYKTMAAIPPGSNTGFKPVEPGSTKTPGKPRPNKDVLDSDASSVEKPTIASKPKFMCTECGGNLMGKTVESKDGKMFCTPCYRVAISNRSCVRCGGEFTPENEHVSYKGQDWHVTCFSCEKCKLPIGKKTFCYQKDGIFCSDCYFETSGRICVKCKKYLKSTGFLFRNEPWHQDCFVCNLCQQSLADKEIFCKDDQPYCINCYDQQYVEKCAKCSKILVGETVEYESKQYHDNCFCCDQCSNPIGSASFFPREGKIFCESCYTEKFGKRCKSCQQIISPSSGFGLVFKEEHYHRDCFLCSKCRKSLVNIPVHSSKSDGNTPFCGDCYDDEFSKRCTACSNVISGVIGSKFMSFQGRYWHVECFNCKICQTSLENRKFAPVQDFPVHRERIIQQLFLLTMR
ncbi:unnamed protein product [Allacma fusca]|uniref:LIM zinc-binding domain-containing protein n=1 Tax=Allacma fusca TaxID=39272 RepID=A0A8J2J6R4_9HEXA|nr:unnamed protein product [Allacma fusca]